ncbi:hypothetical protein HMF8227_01960 [Saliniradius amylolyticus]|uniref:FlgO domain-containing protein n=1 Tax=Saliniradius amylolyticus TaxID=2183582 RepID=A0A2S2E5C6_9ALTE|nr:FlgO family outer membrane protein [Saliniradius amylolyticus]AWL12430.1 hypothetical protein HMF8227_01960 [Saliniradius amylolyticus]
MMNLRAFMVAVLVTPVVTGCVVHPDDQSHKTTVDIRSQAPKVESKPPITNVGGYYGASPKSKSQPLNHYYRQNQPQVDAFGAVQAFGQGAVYADSDRAYYGKELTKHVGDYVRNLTQDLIGNMEYVSDKTPVGVTHFALLDSDLQKTNLLGFQLAESFMHELHKFRIPVLDYKSTDYIRVTEQGDFILSRDFLELEESAPLEYILTGTLTRHQGGYLVNARILGLESKAVVASAQKLIPYYVVEAILPSNEETVDGVKLVEGD